MKDQHTSKGGFYVIISIRPALPALPIFRAAGCCQLPQLWDGLNQRGVSTTSTGLWQFLRHASFLRSLWQPSWRWWVGRLWQPAANRVQRLQPHEQRAHHANAALSPGFRWLGQRPISAASVSASTAWLYQHPATDRLWRATTLSWRSPHVPWQPATGRVWRRAPISWQPATRRVWRWLFASPRATTDAAGNAA